MIKSLRKIGRFVLDRTARQIGNRTAKICFVGKNRNRASAASLVTTGNLSRR